VDILTGFTTSPETFGAVSISAEAKKFMVSMNGTASTVTEKSPYIVRSSFTLPQVAEALGRWAATKAVELPHCGISPLGCQDVRCNWTLHVG
jgi:branched-chain amino acid transport system substrate-binding protein